MKLLHLAVIALVVIVVVAAVALLIPQLTSPTTPGTSTPTTSPTPTKEYKLSVVVGPQSPWGQAAQMWADEVYNKTGGRVYIRVYYSGQLFAG